MSTRTEAERKVRVYVESRLNQADSAHVITAIDSRDDINLGDLRTFLPENGKSSYVEDVVKEADEWLNSHKKTDTWRTVNRLRDALVREASL